MTVNGRNILGPLGIPFLGPWANRLDEQAFYANGKRYALNMDLGNVRGAHPIHGFLSAAVWEVVDAKADEGAAWVTSRLDFLSQPDWMAQFPFAHTIVMTHRLRDGVLDITVALHNVSAAPMPVAIGFHPYFALTDAPRDAWTIGLAARRRGDTVRASAGFLRALSERNPAPGAARELASLAVEAGRFAEAEPLLRRYLSMAGPDPEALSLLAVVLTNLGRPDEGLRSIADARALVTAEGWRGEELEAQVRARAGDAAGCVAALRRLEPQGGLDRSALRADPEYLPIATDPAWVAFLNEKRKN